MQEFEQFQARIERLEAEGIQYAEAVERARLEQAVAAWPDAMGDDLVVWLYGGIDVLEEMDIPKLRIHISSEKNTGPFGFRATHAYECRVTIDSKTLEGLEDALHRVETLLGAWNIVAWGRPIHYYCMFFPRKNVGVRTNLSGSMPAIGLAIDSLDGYTDEQQAILLRAAWWLRQCQSSFIYGSEDASPFDMYMSYWNAFECLVQFICKIRPLPKMTRDEKNRAVADFFSKLPGEPSPEDVRQCYSQYLEPPSFRVKAEHALRNVFGEVGEQYIIECFRTQPENRRLYQIRNDIDHGNIVEYKLAHRGRVESGLARLWHIVYNLFHIAMGLGVIHDPELRVCYTCSNCAADYSCRVGLRPEGEQYWRYVCNSYSNL